jgi:hypothetical protein
VSKSPKGTVGTPDFDDAADREEHVDVPVGRNIVEVTDFGNVGCDVLVGMWKKYGLRFVSSILTSHPAGRSCCEMSSMFEDQGLPSLVELAVVYKRKIKAVDGGMGVLLFGEL